MTPSAFSARRRPSTRAGWWLVIAGWLIQVPAAAGAIFVSDVVAALSLLGAACVAGGGYLLRGKGTVWLVLLAILGGVVIFAGLAVGSAALADGVWGKAATCRVAAVDRQTYEVSHTTGDDRGGTSVTTETRTHYVHTMACPHGTYTVSGDSRRPIGSSATVIYAPRRARAPMFAEQNRGDLSFAVGALATGGLIELLLPIVAWRRGRRPAGAPPAPAPPQPPSGYWHGPGPGPGPRPGPWPGQPGPGQPGPYGAARPAEPVPLESARFEQTVRDSMGRSMSPPEQIALPFIVRLLRRRMGVEEAPPPNPLAGRYPPPPDDHGDGRRR
jgi:hypothetical protein